MVSYQQLSIALPSAKSDIDLPGFSRALKYLRDRGIDKDDIEALKLHIILASDLVSAARNGARSFDDRIAIVIPHFDVHKNPLEWWSSRLVENGLTPVYKGFAQYIDRTQRGKMFCPPGEPPHAYLPPILDWSRLARSEKVFFHESAIKAIAGAKLGTYSIGLNGVWGFCSKKHEIRLVGEVRGLPWKQLGLQPVIVFDSNAEDNWDVKAAIAKLAQTLFEITGQRARHLLLPKSSDGSNRGFDDYAVAEGAQAALDFLGQDGSEIAISDLEVMKAQLNDEVCVVRSMGRIAIQETGTVMTQATFTNLTYADRIVMSEGEDSKPINVPRVWLQDSRRSEVESLSYLPGKPRIWNNQLNIWKGMGVEPVPGDVSPFLNLLENNVWDEFLRLWMLRWLAHPLQNLGEKHNTFLHLFGPQGVGKNLLIRPILRIYGENGITIGKENISSNFSSLYAAKQLVFIDEIHNDFTADAIAFSNKFKRYVTDSTMIVNTKGVPEYVIPNCANFITASNSYRSHKLDTDDRRAAVVRFEPREDHRLHQEYWKTYVEWADGAGAGALYDYLLRLDMGSFDAKGWAPNTEYKEDVIDAGRDPMERWARDLFVNPDDFLDRTPIFKGRNLFTSSELAVLYYGKGKDELRKGQIDAVGAKLRDAGFKQANEKRPVRVNSLLDRYWVIRERNKDWSQAQVCSEHLRKFFTAMK